MGNSKVPLLALRFFKTTKIECQSRHSTLGNLGSKILPGSLIRDPHVSEHHCHVSPSGVERAGQPDVIIGGEADGFILHDQCGGGWLDLAAKRPAGCFVGRIER